MTRNLRTYEERPNVESTDEVKPQATT